MGWLLSEEFHLCAAVCVYSAPQSTHRWGFPAHVLNSILVAQPVAALDGVVRMPPPVVFGHVSERGINAALGRDRVGPCREKLGDACCAHARGRVE